MPARRLPEDPTLELDYQLPDYSNDNRRGTDGFAIAGFVLAMCSLVTFWLFIPPILGVVFSAIGMNKTSDDKADGRGLAIAGLAVSILIIAVWTLYIVAYYDSRGW